MWIVVVVDVVVISSVGEGVVMIVVIDVALGSSVVIGALAQKSKEHHYFESYMWRYLPNKTGI